MANVTGAFAITLPLPIVILARQFNNAVPGKVSLLTGSPRAGGHSLFLFQGPSNRAVAWSITGGGSIVPLAPSTDAKGLAYANYNALNYTGPLTISVTYGG